MTYGRIAVLAGAGPMASQSITNILGKAHQVGIRNIPFHRIVYADGHVWIDQEHRKARMALYKKEGIKIDAEDRIVNFRDILLTM